AFPRSIESKNTCSLLLLYIIFNPLTFCVCIYCCAFAVSSRKLDFIFSTGIHRSLGNCGSAKILSYGILYGLRHFRCLNFFVVLYGCSYNCFGILYCIQSVFNFGLNGRLLLIVHRRCLLFYLCGCGG